MKKIGFFGGSFNPITNAHISIAKQIIEKHDIDKVIFVPVGNHYQKSGLIEEKHRYEMIKKAIQDHNGLEVSNSELNQKKNLTMLEALNKIKREFANCYPYFIIGADNIIKMMRIRRF